MGYPDAFYTWAQLVGLVPYTIPYDEVLALLDRAWANSAIRTQYTSDQRAGKITPQPSMVAQPSMVTRETSVVPSTPTVSPTSTTSSSKVTLRQLVAKYFPANQIDNVLTLIDAESGGYPGAWNPVGEDSRGLLQINLKTHPQWADQDLTNPAVNLRLASQLWRAQGWEPWFNSANNLGLSKGRSASPNQSIGNVVIDTDKSYPLRRAGEYRTEATAQGGGSSFDDFTQWAINKGLLDADPSMYKGLGITYSQLTDYLWSSFGDEYTTETGKVAPLRPGQGGRNLAQLPPGQEPNRASAFGPTDLEAIGGSISQGKSPDITLGPINISELIRNAAKGIRGAEKPNPYDVITAGQYATSWEVPEGPITTAARQMNAVSPSTIKAAAKVVQAGGVVTIEDITEAAAKYGAKRATGMLLASMSQIRTQLVQEYTASGDFEAPEAAADAQVKLLIDSLDAQQKQENAKELILFQNDLKTTMPTDKTMDDYQKAMVANANAQVALAYAKFEWDKENMSPAEKVAAQANIDRLELDAKKFEFEQTKFGSLSASEVAAREANAASLEEQRRHAQEVEAYNQRQLDFQREQERQRIKEAIATASLNAITNLTTARQRANEAYAKAAEYSLGPNQQYALGRGPGGVGERLGLELVDRSKTTPFNAFQGIPQYQSELERILAALAATGG